MNRYEFYTSIQEYNSLQHHGILGQKWGIRRYQNEDGSLTEEGKQRYLNPDGSLNSEGQKKLGKEGVAKFNQTRNKQQWQNGYDEEQQKVKLNNAKENKKWDSAFIDAIQNADDMTEEETYKEYEKYLKNPNKYVENFDSNNWRGTSKKESKPKVSDFTQDEIKKLLGDEIPDKELKEKAKSVFGPKATPEEEAKFWKALAKEYEKGNIKGASSNSSESKKSLTKEEKKEAKAAAKEVQKQLKGGLISNWALLNKAMKEAGITDQKNMTASDWNKVNEKIKELRK